MGTSKTILSAVQAASRNKAVRSAAAGLAVKHGVPVVQERYGAWRDRRIDRDRAVKLARQMGGRYSRDTIIGGEPHFVVWKDGVPVQAFPHVADLASRPELAGFDARLAAEPSPPRPARSPRHLPGRRPPAD